MDLVGGEERMKDRLGLTGRVIRGSALGLAYCAAVAMLCLLAITVGAVVMRYLLKAPVLGAQDISEVCLSLVIFLGLAHCGWRGGHVAVDLISMLMAPMFLRWTDLVVRLAGAALLFFMAWITWSQARVALEYGEATNLIEIPHFPFIAVAASSFMLYGVILLALAWRSLMNLPDPSKS